MKTNFKCGLEIHVQLGGNVKSKIFCGCPNPANLNQKNIEPNTLTCPTCLGMPGAKPSFNKEVLNDALKVALALNCEVNQETFFSRKTYFFPDLASSYQITQYEIPLAKEGGFQNIKIRRIHMEEDPGKLIHEGNYVLIDYNRSGTPLIEIVTEPEFKSTKEVRVFLQKLLTLLEYLGVYNRKSESSLRVDANISTTGARVEVKNIGSIKDVEKALNSEVERQKENVPKIQETRGWDDNLQNTYLMRIKETEEDYGYLMEPNLTRLTISKEKIEQVKKILPELADEKTERFVEKYKMSLEDANVIASDLKLADLFEKVVKDIDVKIATRFFVREILKVLNYTGLSLSEWKITGKELIELLSLLQEKKISETTAQKVLEKLSEKLFSPLEYVEKEKLGLVSSDKELEKYCEEAIKENSKAVEDYKNGEENSLNFIVGIVMKKRKNK